MTDECPYAEEVHDLRARVDHLQSLLTPRRIDEDTPDGVLVWVAGSWTEADREDRGTWMDSDTSEYFHDQPKWWLPMLPAPEDK